MLSQVSSDPRDLISNAIMLSQASNKSRSLCRSDEVGGLAGGVAKVIRVEVGMMVVVKIGEVVMVVVPVGVVV